MNPKKLSALSEQHRKQERQLVFILELWTKADASYTRIAAAVEVGIRGTLHEVRQHEHGVERDELMRDLKSMLEIIAFLRRADSIGIWSGSTSNLMTPVASLTSAGAPILGKR